MFVKLRRRIYQWLRSKAQVIRTVRGFRVVVENTRFDIQTEAVLTRLGEALELIERHQPWRIAHMRRDLVQIWIVRYPCRGAYFEAQRTCMIELTFLARRDIGAETVAACIVHEATHARIERRGIQHSNENMARAERTCRRAELSFGRSLPTDLGSAIIQRSLASLQLSDDEIAPDIDWREARRRQREIDRDAFFRRAKRAV